MRFIKPKNGCLTVSHANVKYDVNPIIGTSRTIVMSTYMTVYIVMLFFSMIKTLVTLMKV